MSQYIRCRKTRFKDLDTLKRALMRLGYAENAIEVAADNTLPMYGYHDDLREERAIMRIDRSHVGHQSNDLGFARDEEGFIYPIISKYDIGHLRAKHRVRDFEVALKVAFAEEIGQDIQSYMLGSLDVEQEGAVERIYVRA